MGIQGCSGVSKDTYLNKSEKEHQMYCKTKENPFNPLNACSTAEGCKYDWGAKKCNLNTGETLSSAYINGGFGFGKLCLSKEFTRLILMILFPPSYVFIKEWEKGFTNKGAIIMSFIYTCIFYFPGLIYTLMYKHGSAN